MKIEVFEITSKEDATYKELMAQYKSNTELQELLDEPIISGSFAGYFSLSAMINMAIEMEHINLYLLKDVDDDIFVWVAGKNVKRGKLDMYPLLKEQSDEMKEEIRDVLFREGVYDKSNNEAFIYYAEKGSQMDKQRAIYLLIQRYVCYCGVSAGMRTVVWDAAWTIFSEHENEIPFETECFSDFEFLNKINPNYTKEISKEYDIAILYEKEEYFRICMMIVAESDDETNSAVCYGISLLELEY